MSEEEKIRVLREWATEELYPWLLEHEPAMVEFLAEGAGLALTERVRLKGSTGVSHTMLSVTALRLRRSFGEEAAAEMYDLDTWAGSAGFAVGFLVDYEVLADKLLCRFVPEYVPRETRIADEEN